MKPQLSCSVIKGKVKPPLTGSLSADGYLWCWAAWWWRSQKHLGGKPRNAPYEKPRRSWKAEHAIIGMSWTPSWLLVTEISTCKPFVDGEQERQVLNTPWYHMQHPAGGLPHRILKEKKQPHNNKNKENNKAKHWCLDVASRNYIGVPQMNLLSVCIPTEQRRKTGAWFTRDHPGVELRVAVKWSCECWRSHFLLKVADFPNNTFPFILQWSMARESCWTAMRSVWFTGRFSLFHFSMLFLDFFPSYSVLGFLVAQVRKTSAMDGGSGSVGFQTPCGHICGYGRVP